MPLTSARLTRMKGRAESYLVDTCKIEYPTRTSDSMGGWSEAWGTRGTAVPCALFASWRVAAAEMGVEGGAMTTYLEYALHIASDGTIEPGDRVTMGGDTFYAEGVVPSDSFRATIVAKLTREGT